MQCHHVSHSSITIDLESFAAFLKGSFSLGLNGRHLGISSVRSLRDIRGISAQSSIEKVVNILEEIPISVPPQTPPASWAPSNKHLIIRNLKCNYLKHTSPL